MHIGIIGAGIGGACLAHGLRKKGITVSLFERNSGQAELLPGYGIHINLFGQKALKECIPAKNWDRFAAAGKTIGGKVRFYDEKLSILFDQPVFQTVGGSIQTESRVSISRVQLKEILNDGLEDVIDWNKQFVRYEILPDQRVCIYFADGTSDCVDLLVAADGSNSKVRKQLLPMIDRIELGITIISGRTRLTEILRKTLPPAIIDGTPNSVVPTTPDWMFLSVWTAPVDVSVPVSHSVLDEYLVWAYVLPGKVFKKEINSGKPEELVQYVIGKIQSWNPYIMTAVSGSDLPSVHSFPLKSMPVSAHWKSSPVTLIGDAIHNMTPMAGVGANTALRDAALLSELLGKANVGKMAVIEAVNAYESQMRRYANYSVALSEKNSINAVSGSALKKRLFRLMLRLTKSFPRLGRLLFPPGI